MIIPPALRPVPEKQSRLSRFNGLQTRCEAKPLKRLAVP